MEHSEHMVQQVWEKGRATGEQDRDTWRKDQCGAWIRREHYARAESEFGWKISNISAGGPDSLENLQPLNCANTYDRANHHAQCHLAADMSGVPAPERVLEPRNRKA